MRLLSNKTWLIWVVGLAAAASVWLLSSLPSRPFERFHILVFDAYQRVTPRVWAGSDIVIIDLDEASIKRVGQWPWPRRVVADLTDRLGQMGAATIVFDIVFSEPDRTSPLLALADLAKAGAQIELPEKVDMLDHDTTLAAAFARNRVVSAIVLSGQGSDEPPVPKAGTAFSGTQPPDFMREGVKAIRNLPALDMAATGIGAIDFATTAQRDAVVRNVPLVTGANGRIYPSLAMETLRVVQGAGGFKIKSSDGSGEVGGGALSIVSTQVGALEVPTNADGAIDIYHSPASQKPTLSAKDVLYPSESALGESAIQAEIANHIVLVGTSAAGLLDLRATPLQPVVAGVTIHADIMDQIIAGAHISRPDFGAGLERFVGLVLTIVLLIFLPRLNAVGDIAMTLLLSALVIVGFWYAFKSQQILLSPIVPVLSLLAAYSVGVAADLLVTEKQGRFVRDAFSHYLSPAMVERLADDPDSLKLGGEDKELTLLFCDIRGFTSLSEGLNPVELTELLNNFLTPMTDALLSKGATIDKYMGDAIMAFWNAPIDQADHRDRACAGLLAMREELAKLNARADRAIEIGIGLNTGPCCVGNLGSSQRFNYSAIGDAVNVASRIEGLTKQYGLDNLVSEETLENLEGYATLEIDRVGVVGREQPLTVYTILGPSDLNELSEMTRLREAHDHMLDAYRAGDAEEGLVAMTRALNASHGLEQAAKGPSFNKLYALYASRLGTFREEGVPDGWDGVYRSTSK